MSSPSNLYAEKVFSEHPTVLWALDDTVDYISLLTEDTRNFSSWQITGGTSSLGVNIVDEPFPNSLTNVILGEVPSGTSGQVVCISDNLVNFTDLNPELETFCIGTYFYSDSPFLSGFEIGYEYADSTTGDVIQNLKSFETSVYGKWLFISETFTPPKDNTTARLVLKINYIKGPDRIEEYRFLVNGFTFGQWSEEFNSASLGVSPVQVDSSINITPTLGIEAKAYGLQDEPGYYLINDSSLGAKNSGVPLVYGASNATVLDYNQSGKPSLIVPGKGFLNNSGKFNYYSVEFWMKINSNAIENKRIFGPIGSTDGLYVRGPFISLKIGDNFKSYCVGEWDRPMLIDIRIIKDSASLLINGEEVILLDFITRDLSFPEKLQNGKDQDWLGFYAYSDVSPITLDCIGIYSYQVPSVLAKKRFVYGQGVEIPENINAAYSGNSVVVDYPFAEYTNNYMYPDIGRWDQGLLDNLSIDNNALSVPNHSLPKLVLSSNKTESALYEDNKAAQNESDTFFTFAPNSSWSTTSGYLRFDSFEPSGEAVGCFYGVFKYKQIDESKSKTLIRLEDDFTKNYFSINLVGSQIEYVFSYNGTESIIYTSYGIPAGSIFCVGVSIDSLINSYGGNVASFFNSRSGIKVYVGGNKSLAGSFDGNIYKVGFCSNRNTESLSSLFASSGFPKEYENVFNQYDDSIDYDAGNSYFGNDPTYWAYVLDGGDPSSFVSTRISDHLASYTLIPKVQFNKFSFDIDASSYWEDNIPLTYFAKYIHDNRGNKIYDLDFLQFNLNYPSASIFKKSTSRSTWTYAELLAEYQNPTQRDYSSLDNHLFTGYDTYEDLANRSENTYSYDTSDALVKSYISFQYVKNGANAASRSFKYSVSLDSSGVVLPGTYTVDRINGVDIADNFLNTKYEVVNNTIIYPPSGIDFNDLSVVVHLEFEVKNILTNPLKIKSLQLASQSFNQSTYNEIGTRFGNTIYPYKRSGLYYDYKGTNPFSIYKGSSPYLYLTKYSGIQVRGKIDPLVNRGLAIPINKSLSSNYKVMSLQLAMRYDEQEFPYSATEIFEVESKNGNIIKFFIVSNSPNGKRGKIYAVNANTGQIEDGVTFYLNGKLVNDPIVTIHEWCFLGISFPNLLNFDGFAGAIRVNGPMLVNLISDYKSTNLQEVQNVTKRPWFKVVYSGPLELDWDYWTYPYKWGGVLILSSKSYYGADPSDVYKSYTGTNKIIVDDYNSEDSNSPRLSFNNYKYSVYSELRWKTSVEDAV